MRRADERLQGHRAGHAAPVAHLLHRSAIAAGLRWQMPRKALVASRGLVHRLKNSAEHTVHKVWLLRLLRLLRLGPEVVCRILRRQHAEGRRVAHRELRRVHIAKLRSVRRSAPGALNKPRCWSCSRSVQCGGSCWARHTHAMCPSRRMTAPQSGARSRSGRVAGCTRRCRSCAGRMHRGARSGPCIRHGAGPRRRPAAIRTGCLRSAARSGCTKTTRSGRPDTSCCAARGEARS